MILNILSELSFEPTSRQLLQLIFSNNRLLFLKKYGHPVTRCPKTHFRDSSWLSAGEISTRLACEIWRANLPDYRAESGAQNCDSLDRKRLLTALENSMLDHLSPHQDGGEEEEQSGGQVQNAGDRRKMAIKLANAGAERIVNENLREGED